MRKHTLILLSKILFSIFCLFFLISVIAMIILLKLFPDQTIGIIISAVSLIVSLPSSVLTFLSLLSLSKEYKPYTECRNFSDRIQIIKQIIVDINNGYRTIKIAGTPISGVSELLIRIAELKKKKILETYIDNKKDNKTFRKKIGNCFYIDGKNYSSYQLLKEELIEISKTNRFSRKTLLLDHIYCLQNPNIVLEFIELSCSKKIITICDIGTMEDDDSYKISAFNTEDIKELAITYGRSLSDHEADCLYDLSWGNIGLLTIFLRNGDKNKDLLINNVHELSNSLDRNIYGIINKILDNTDTRQLAVLCATLNYCSVKFNLEMLCKITQCNIGISSLTSLANTGLFIKKGNVFFSNNYFSYLIRNEQNFSAVSNCVNLIIKYYEKIKDEKSLSIMLLCKSCLSGKEIQFILKTLNKYSVAQKNQNINYIVNIYNAYAENRMIDFSETVLLQSLKQEIIFQYISALIFIGNYNTANDALSICSEYSERFIYLKADLLHLQNQYDEAIGNLTYLIQNTNSTSLKQQSILKLTHCYKHIGHLDEAIDILNKIIQSPTASDAIKIKAKVYSLAILIQNNDYDELQERIAELELIENNLKDYQKATLIRYRAVNYAMKNKFIEAINEINTAIDICKNTDSRLILNCYYIRGEIYRHFKFFNNAYKDFLSCYKISFRNGDYNLRSMAVISIKLIGDNVKQDTVINDDDVAKIIDSCFSKNMKYNVDLLTRVMQNYSIGNNIPDSICSHIYIVP